MSFLTDRARAHNHGSAKEGVEHWWGQRMTAIALVPLGLLFIFPFAMTVGRGYDAVLALYTNPIHAIVASLFIIVGFNHLRLGIQVVVEDYVHGAMGKTLLILNGLFCVGFACAGVFAVAKIASPG